MTMVIVRTQRQKEGRIIGENEYLQAKAVLSRGTKIPGTFLLPASRTVEKAFLLLNHLYVVLYDGSSRKLIH
jgi:hypothetical protein